jgi:hypothetical protein
MGVGRWNQMNVAGDGIDPATDRPSSPSPLSVGAQDRPHTLVAKVPPPGRRAGASAAEGVGARELRVCVTHLLVRMAMVLPAERRGAEPRARRRCPY